MMERAWLRKRALVTLWKRCTSLWKEQEYKRYKPNLKTAIVVSRNEMARKCLRNCLSIKGSMFVLKTKQDFDRSGPEWSRFAIKLTWWIWRDCIQSARERHANMCYNYWCVQPLPLVSTTANKEELPGDVWTASYLHRERRPTHDLAQPGAWIWRSRGGIV